MSGAAVRSYTDIPGWFRWVDKTMFDAILRTQQDGPTGDVVELGGYLGKSAVVLGNHLREGERLVVVDLFGADPADFAPEQPRHAANRRENRRAYAAVGREKFEANYLALHDALPVVVTGPSAYVVDHVAPASARFVHVDAGHLYDDVHDDIRAVRSLLADGGVVAFDDYRSEHTPGVAAAIWEEVVVGGGLRPFALSGNKLYGSYGDADRYVDALEDLVRDDKRYTREVQEIRGSAVLRIGLGKQPAPPPPPPPGATLAELQAIATDVVARVVGAGHTGGGSR